MVMRDAQDETGNFHVTCIADPATCSASIGLNYFGKIHLVNEVMKEIKKRHNSTVREFLSLTANNRDMLQLSCIILKKAAVAIVV